MSAPPLPPPKSQAKSTSAKDGGQRRSSAQSKSVQLPTANEVPKVAKDAGEAVKKEVAHAAESVNSLLEYILKKIEEITDSCKADSGFSLTIGLAVVSILALNIYKNR